MTEEVATEKYDAIDVYTSAFRPLRNTVSGNTGRAMMKILVDADSDKVIGIHMVGDDSAEIMQVKIKFPQHNLCIIEWD